jgi:hypothetical protein
MFSISIVRVFLDFFLLRFSSEDLFWNQETAPLAQTQTDYATIDCINESSIEKCVCIWFGWVLMILITEGTEHAKCISECFYMWLLHTIEMTNQQNHMSQHTYICPLCSRITTKFISVVCTNHLQNTSEMPLECSISSVITIISS